MRDYLTEAEALAEELRSLRERLHRTPELGNREHRTAEIAETYLRDLGISVSRPFGTAVVGTLIGGKPGQCAALRADMDALPIQEATGASFASENPGVMHACGHDIHMTAALGAAKLLSAHRDELPGTVLFLFQPDEEGDGGARPIIDAGVIDRTDAVFGAHVSPDLPLGHVGVRYGKFYAAANLFHLTVLGRSCHGAEREKGVDALAAAARLVTELIALPEHFPGERSVVTVGMLQGGTADNIVPGRAELRGIIRTLGPDTRSAMLELFRRTVSRIEAETGAAVEIRLREGYPGIVNHDRETRLAEETAAGLLGPERVRRIEIPTLTTEDFGYFLLKKPGTFYHLGAGCGLPLHSPGFLPDPRAAVIGAAMHASVLEAFLNEKNSESLP